MSDKFSDEREVICFRLLTVLRLFSSGRETFVSMSDALAPG